MTDETRYAKSQRIKEQKADHETRVQKLASGPVETYELWLERNQPACVKAGLPSAWTDWDSNPDYREDYETDAPTERDAEKLCAKCPIRAVELGGNGVCLAYAKATGQSHGVWGGIRREDGKWLSRQEHTAKAT